MYIQHQRELLEASAEVNIFETSTDWLRDSLAKPSLEEFLPVNRSGIRLGRFYFIMYDLAGKSTKLEKLVPCFTVDFRQYPTWNSLYVVNTNFLPYEFRNRLFDNMLRRYDTRLYDDFDKPKVADQLTYEFKYKDFYEELKRFGFEWSLRELVTSKIDKAYEIHTARYAEILNINSTKLTGIDEKAIEKIWKAKIRKQAIREQELLKELSGDIKPEVLSKMTPEQRREQLIKAGVDLSKFMT